MSAPGYFIDGPGTADGVNVATLAEACDVLAQRGVDAALVRSVRGTPVNEYIGHELELGDGRVVAIEGVEVEP